MWTLRSTSWRTVLAFVRSLLPSPSPLSSLASNANSPLFDEDVTLSPSPLSLAPFLRLVLMSVSPRDPSNRRQLSTSSIASSTGGRNPRTSVSLLPRAPSHSFLGASFSMLISSLCLPSTRRDLVSPPFSFGWVWELEGEPTSRRTSFLRSSSVPSTISRSSLPDETLWKLTQYSLDLFVSRYGVRSVLCLLERSSTSELEADLPLPRSLVLVAPSLQPSPNSS